MNKPTIISMLVADLPKPSTKSIQMECMDCGEAVWVATKQIMKPELEVTKDTVDALCMPCYVKRAEEK